MSKWSMFRDAAAGKWQFPLLLVSLVCLAASLYRAAPRPSRLPLPQAITQLESLVESGVYGHALELGDVLLAREDCEAPQAAPIRRLLARSGYAQASRRPGGSIAGGRYVVEQYQKAESGGAELTGDDLSKVARALEWQGQFSAAIEYYQRALACGASEPWELRRHVLETTRDRLQASPGELREQLGAFLGEVPDSRPDLRLWAVEEQLTVLEELGQVDDSGQLLAENAGHFAESEFRNRFEYLEAMRLYKVGEFDQAERQLRALRNRLRRDDAVHAMSGWLLGRVVLRDGGSQRPLEALSFFEDVVRSHPSGPYAAASRVGMGEALALLERHDEAAAAYEMALADLETLGEQRIVSHSLLAVSLAVASEAQRQNDRLQPAVDYARLAVRLVDRNRVDQASVVLQQFAGAAQQLAENAQDETVAAELHADAGAAYLEIAKLNVLHDRRAAEASWQAAEAYAKARDTAQAVKLFEQYTLERPGDPLVPRAWLRIAELRREARQLRSAIVAYQECYRRFPRTLDGARALVPLARCYLSFGSDELELAEKTLRVVLEESDIFTPEAPEFADALFLLGDVLSRRSEFERAISTLEEAIERYPNDPRVSRARFLLADAYRRSGLALREKQAGVAFNAPVEGLRAESTARLAAAGELFRQVIDEFELHAEPRDRLDQMYERHARFCEADCYFEMRDYRRALTLYEEAAGKYKDLSAALAAYVQIINCHVFLGRPEEARAALGRALVLVEGLSQEAFDYGVAPQTRGDWKEYFAWLGEAEVF